jgi:hypothetical protein
MVSHHGMEAATGPEAAAAVDPPVAPLAAALVAAALVLLVLDVLLLLQAVSASARALIPATAAVIWRLLLENTLADLR